MLLYSESQGVPFNVWLVVPQPVEAGNYVMAEILHYWAGNSLQDVARPYLEGGGGVLDRDLSSVSQLDIFDLIIG